MIIRKGLGVISVSLIIAGSLVGCDSGQSKSDVDSYLARLKGAKVVQKSDDTKKATPPRQSSYQSAKRRSPFEVREITNTKAGLNANPLQAYPLDMLRFVGTVTQNGKTVAFVSAPDNRIYQIKVGDMIGDRQGKVVAIESEQMRLIESYNESGLGKKQRQVTLQLKEAE